MGTGADNHHPGRGGQEGAVLLLVMLVLTLISVLILSWAQAWRTELKLAGSFVQVQKCRRLAEAGIFYALGKLAGLKAEELASGQAETLHGESAPGDLWQGDQRRHGLELPDGRVEIRIEDEGGKLNLNSAKEETLNRLFRSLKLAEPQVRTMVDSLLDWRSPDKQPRAFGAKSNYYLGLNPPYVAKNGPFETVEELAWVQGFEGSPLLPRLGRCLTVQHLGTGINVNTAPLEVLLAAGLAPDAAQSIIAARQEAPLRNFQDFARLQPDNLVSQQQNFVYKSSPFFTITATGLLNNSKGRQTIRAIVRVDPNREEPWTIYSWFEGFPG